MHAGLHAYIHTYIHTHIHIYTYLHTLYNYICAHTHTHTCMFTHIRTIIWQAVQIRQNTKTEGACTQTHPIAGRYVHTYVYVSLHTCSRRCIPICSYVCISQSIYMYMSVCMIRPAPQTKTPAVSVHKSHLQLFTQKIIMSHKKSSFSMAYVRIRVIAYTRVRITKLCVVLWQRPYLPLENTVARRNCGRIASCSRRDAHLRCKALCK
jgi:hypothetical protein